MSKRDYYEVLGVSKSATDAEIKKAYLKLAKKHHPDRNNGDAESEKKFKEAGEAYDVLKDEQKKSAYDRFGHQAFANGGPGASGFSGHSSQSGFSGADVNDIFGDFFSDFMGGRSSQGARRKSSKIRGSDLKYNLSISLEEAFKGIDKDISFSTEIKCNTCDGNGAKNPNDVVTCSHCNGAGVVRMQQGFFAVEQTCGKCNGSGQGIKNPCGTCYGVGRVNKHKHLIVNIPAGIEDSTRIRIAGEGEAGVRGGTAGDLYVFVNIKEHDIYRVEGNDLHFKLPLSFTKAILGGEVKVPTIDGSEVMLKIPECTETGDRLRLRGKGMSKVRSSVRGDLYAHAYVQAPKKLTKKQKELLMTLDNELDSVDVNYKNEGFFTKMKNMWL